jgi:hypothetical protein
MAAHATRIRSSRGHPGAARCASQPGALSSSNCKLQTPPKEQEPIALVVVMGGPRRGGPASTRSSPAASITSSTHVHGPPVTQHSATVEVERAAPPQRPPLAADAGRCHIHPMLDLARLIAIHGARRRGRECEVVVRHYLARRRSQAIHGAPMAGGRSSAQAFHGRRGKLDPGQRGLVCSHVLRGG